MFKGVTARRLYKPFGVKGLTYNVPKGITVYLSLTCFLITAPKVFYVIFGH
jgi:hypothetical protein